MELRIELQLQWPCTSDNPTCQSESSVRSGIASLSIIPEPRPCVSRILCACPAVAAVASPKIHKSHANPQALNPEPSVFEPLTLNHTASSPNPNTGIAFGSEARSVARSRSLVHGSRVKGHRVGHLGCRVKLPHIKESIRSI